MTTLRFMFLLLGIFSASMWVVPGVYSQTPNPQPPTPNPQPPAASSPANPIPPPPAPTPLAPAVEQVDINSADVATLDRVLDGIGPKKAQAIVDFREKHGPFKTISDFQRVPGIGPKIIERNQSRILIIDPNASKPIATPAAGQPAPKPEEAKPQPAETKPK